MIVSIYPRFCEGCRIIRAKGQTRIVHLGKPSHCARRAS